MMVSLSNMKLLREDMMNKLSSSILELLKWKESLKESMNFNKEKSLDFQKVLPTSNLNAKDTFKKKISLSITTKINLLISMASDLRWKACLVD